MLSKMARAGLNVYIVAVLGLFLSSADLYLGRIKVIPAPTVTCLFLLLPLFVLAVARDFVNRSRGSELLYVLKNNAAAVLCFGLIGFFSIALSLHPGAYWLEEGRWIFLILYGYLIFVLAICLPTLPEVKRLYPLAATIGLIALSSSIITDVFSPGTFSKLLSRAAGFPQNANWAALSSVMVCCGCLSFGRSKHGRMDAFVLFLTSIAVFSTLSRSGMMELLIVLAVYFYINIFRGGLKVRKVFVMAASAVVFTVFVVVAGSLLIEHSEMFTKYRTRIGRVGSSSSVDDGSSEHRMRAVIESLDLVSKSPIIGNGTAHTRTMLEAPHNMYLMQWVNNGIFGVFGYLMLLLGSLYTFRKRHYYPGQAFIAAVIVGSFFSHNVLDQRPFLITLGVMWTLSLYQRDEDRALHTSADILRRSS